MWLTNTIFSVASDKISKHLKLSVVKSDIIKLNKVTLNELEPSQMLTLCCDPSMSKQIHL